MTTWTAMSWDTIRGLAPDAVDAFCHVIGALGSAYDVRRLEIVRRRIAMVLQLPDDVLPEVGEPPNDQVGDLAAWPTSPAFDEVDRTLLGFAEQFVMDVAAVAASDRQRLGACLGELTFGFVQAVYVLDQVARLSAVTRQLFGDSPFDRPVANSAGALWPAMEQMMTAVMTIGGVDPLTAELVRLRGARLHNCRLCQSRRRVAAVTADVGLLETPDPLSAPAATASQRAALALTDVILLSPGTIDPATAREVQAHLTPAQALEVMLLVAHNAANKIAVALGADAPTVTDGVEYYEVGAAGDYEYGLPSPH